MTKASAAATRLRSSQMVRWTLLAIITLIFLVFLYPHRVITTFSYELGDVVESDVKAPMDFFVEDARATEEKQQQAMEEVLTVYDLNRELSSRLEQRIMDTFSHFRTLQKETHERVAVEMTTPAPSEAVAPPDGGVAIDVDPAAAEATGAVAAPEVSEKEIQARVAEILTAMKTEFEKRLGVTVSTEAFPVLINDGFSKDTEGLIRRILTQVLENGVVPNKELLLQESERGILLRSISTSNERVVHNLKQMYGVEQAMAMVRIFGQPLLKNRNYIMRNLIVDIVQGLLQPNITLNRSETERRRQAAAVEIKPIMYRIKAGEMLLREGERVTQTQLVKTRALASQMEARPVAYKRFGAGIIVACLLFTIYFLYLRHPRHASHDNNKDLFFIATILISFLLLVKASIVLAETMTHNDALSLSSLSVYFGIPLASGAMTVCLFMGLNVAIALSLVMAICAAIVAGSYFNLFIFYFLSGAMAAYWVRDCRERNVLIIAGAKLGLFNMVLAIAVSLHATEPDTVKLLWELLFAALGGLAAGVVTTGIAPFMEMLFRYTTDIKLLELANLDRPILRRLMIEAPGTYHHSIVVGSLVEAAAADIGANSLLAKVCGYYHDIGKVKQPLYFIENQGRGKNKHDKLAPSMSALILISHIKNGVELAREHKLGQPIMDTIRQHHGTSLISFFYEKARKLKGEDAVKIENFKYPGPNPQTREAALVMLADVVEAASRTLDNPTPARIQGLVQKLINKIFSDGQLDECDLTLRDLHKIARSFIQILTGIHHHRIEYPESTQGGNGKGKNGHSDRQSTKPSADKPEGDSEQDKSHLKRLGLS
jgi:putative nucleotidyltransferase with HDIG domain